MAIRHSARPRCAFAGCVSRFGLDEGVSDTSGGGMHNDFTLARIDDDNVAIHEHVRQRSPDDRGNAFFTGQNRGVRCRTAVGSDERTNNIEIEQRSVCGSEVSSDENERGFRLRNTWSGNSQDSRDDTIGDISEIARTLGHVATRRLQSRGKTSKGVEDRALSGGSAIDPVLHISEQHGVIGHHGQCIQNIFRESAGLYPASTKVQCGLA